MKPLILHIPHASTFIPEDTKPQFLLSHDEIQAELLRATDWFTDDLFGVLGFVAVQHEVSRLVVDPERFENDADEVMAERGLGAVYTSTFGGTPLKTVDNRSALMERFYYPHHDRLTEAVSLSLEANGSCLIVDCHSYPSVPLPSDLDQTPGRPDFCLGTDSFHTPQSLTDKFASLLETSAPDRLSSVTIDRPYRGTIVPMTYYQKDSRVASIMIEINRNLYINEATAEPLPGYALVRESMHTVISKLADWWSAQH